MVFSAAKKRSISQSTYLSILLYVEEQMRKQYVLLYHSGYQLQNLTCRLLKWAVQIRQIFKIRTEARKVCSASYSALVCLY